MDFVTKKHTYINQNDMLLNFLHSYKPLEFFVHQNNSIRIVNTKKPN